MKSAKDYGYRAPLPKKTGGAHKTKKAYTRNSKVDIWDDLQIIGQYRDFSVSWQGKK